MIGHKLDNAPKRRALLAVAAPGLLMPRILLAQAPSSRPLRIVVAWPPGGGADTPVRLAAGPLQAALNQTVVVENRGGASGSIGAAAVAQAAPDGSTLLVDASPHATNATLMRGLSFDYATAFTPVTLLVISPLLLVVRADGQFQTLADLLAFARTHPGEVTYASSGIGVGTHLAPALLMRRAGVTATHVPYRGGSQSVAGLLGGETTCCFSTLPQAVPLVQDKRLRALAVGTRERLANLPDVPTVAEQGFPGFELSEWTGIWAPAGTPVREVSRLHQGFVQALADPTVRARLAQIGQTPSGMDPNTFATFVATERTRLSEFIRAEGIRLD